MACVSHLQPSAPGPKCRRRPADIRLVLSRRLSSISTSLPTKYERFRRRRHFIRPVAVRRPQCIATEASYRALRNDTLPAADCSSAGDIDGAATCRMLLKQRSSAGHGFVAVLACSGGRAALPSGFDFQHWVSY